MPNPRQGGQRMPQGQAGAPPPNRRTAAADQAAFRSPAATTGAVACWTRSATMARPLQITPNSFRVVRGIVRRAIAATVTSNTKAPAESQP